MALGIIADQTPLLLYENTRVRFQRLRVYVQIQMCFWAFKCVNQLIVFIIRQETVDVMGVIDQKR